MVFQIFASVTSPLDPLSVLSLMSSGYILIGEKWAAATAIFQMGIYDLETDSGREQLAVTWHPYDYYDLKN